MNDDHSNTAADELVRGYLHYRGLTQTVSTFEQELKTEHHSKVQVEKIVEEILSSIEKHDIDSLKKIWTTFNERVFNSLSGEESRLAQQYENDVYRLYLVKCVQKNDKQKCVEFFTKIAPLAVNNPQWNEWFTISYVQNAKDREPFKKYFVKQWQEIFLISLHNFLSITMQSVEKPLLLRMIEAAMQESSSSPTSGRSGSIDEELIDDFAVIAQCSGPMKAASSKPSLKNLFKSITGKRND
ncbi:unnamed protein product, partial [Mesorhabditis belari]|uniref:ARMC9 CTLH-like domain-containing protein n=1 Tax=Mesorhabditis belari TaxID=2138241 RepID=A0AAF3ERR8_9BILA